mgnify:CR=1 FL=1
MKLHSMTMNNFMPYKGQTRVDFPQDEFQNVMLVFGDNMRGKTSLLNALRWGFYNRAVGRHSIVIPLYEILNKEAALEGDWTLEVHIEFEANGHVYDLRRRAEKRSTVGTPTREEDYQCQVYLRKDGIPVQGDLVNAEINGIAPQQVSRFFLFDGELLGEYEMLLVEGSDQGRQIKEAIEQVLGVPALIHGRDELGTLLKAARKTQQQDLQRVAGLEQHAQQQAELSARQETFERDNTALQSKLETVRSERMTLDDDIETSQNIYAAKSRLDLLLDRQGQIEDYRDQKKGERLELLSQSWRDLVEIKVSIRREQMEKERNELSLQIKKEAGIETQISQLKKLLETQICPTCRQELAHERREQIGADLGRLQGDLALFKDNTETLQHLSSQIQSLSKIRGINARDRISQVDRDLQRHEVELTKIENESAKLRDEIAGYDTVEIARKRAFRDAKLQEEATLQRDIINRKKDLEKVKGDLAVTQRTIEGLTQTRSQRSTIKATVCSDLEMVFAQSIERLRDRLRKAVEQRATEAFRKMTTQKTFRGLEINQGYGLSILDDHSRKVTIRSAGAEQVVALSLIDGLNRTGRAAGPIVMDTPFGRLDLKHRDNILSYLPTVTSQFVLLVHSGEIRPETDLEALSPRIGAVYKIREINSRHSVIERQIA